MFGGLAGRQAEDTLHFPLVNSTKWGTPQPNVACVDVYCSVCTSRQIETMIQFIFGGEFWLFCGNFFLRKFWKIVVFKMKLCFLSKNLSLLQSKKFENMIRVHQQITIIVFLSW
jgi:hypothetical protein